MHEKGICIDRLITITGSWNFSNSASLQTNHMDFIRSEERARWFLDMWEDLRTHMIEQEGESTSGSGTSTPAPLT